MKRFIAFSAMAAFSVLASCKQEQDTLSVNIISLVDFSQSRDTSVVWWYKETIEHSVIEKMGTKDKLIILPIDFNSETSSQELFKIDFSKNNYSNEYAGLQKNEIEQQNHLDSIHAAVQQFDILFESARQARSKLKGGTDIFGALKQCRKYMMPRGKNIVVIFSDMLEYTDKANWNFEENLNTSDEIEHYLSAAEEIDMNGMQIIVLCGAQNNMQPEKFGAVRTFWEKYFARCGGSLIDYSSGAVTVLEQTLGK